MTKTRIGELPAEFELAGRLVAPQRRAVSSGGRSTRISPRALQVLLRLTQEHGRVVSHDELIGAVWRGAAVGDEVLFKAISELRSALGDRDRTARIIETIPKVGYRLAVTPKQQTRGWRAVPVAVVSVLTSLVATIVVANLPGTPNNEQAMHLMDKAAYVLENDGDVDRALSWLDDAISLDPASAGAYALRGEALLRDERRWHAARIAIEHALALNPDHARALMARARIALESEWDWRRARTLMDRALEAEPENPMVHLGLAAWNASRGRHEASITAAKRAVELDPVNAIVKGDLAFFYYLAGDHRAVLQEAERVFELVPGNRFAKIIKLETLFALGQADLKLAAEVARDRGASELQLERLRGSPLADVERAYVDLLASLTGADASTTAVERARIFARQGRHIAALFELEQAIASRTVYLPYLPLDPQFARLWHEPRFQALLRQAGHPLAEPDQVI